MADCDLGRDQRAALCSADVYVLRASIAQSTGPQCKLEGFECRLAACEAYTAVGCLPVLQHSSHHSTAQLQNAMLGGSVPSISLSMPNQGRSLQCKVRLEGLVQLVKEEWLQIEF